MEAVFFLCKMPCFAPSKIKSSNSQQNVKIARSISKQSNQRFFQPAQKRQIHVNSRIITASKRIITFSSVTISQNSNHSPPRLNGSNPHPGAFQWVFERFLKALLQIKHGKLNNKPAKKQESADQISREKMAID